MWWSTSWKILCFEQSILPLHWDSVSSHSSPLTLLFFSKNNLVCLLSEKLNVSSNAETPPRSPPFFFFFLSSSRAQMSTEKVWWKIFHQTQLKKGRNGEENMTFVVDVHEAHIRTPYVCCGSEEESACLWSEGNPIIFLASASCSNFALPLRQNPTLRLSLKAM